MENLNVFDDVLDIDEKIEKIVKPNKAKFCLSTVMLSILSLFFYAMIYSTMYGSQFDENNVLAFPLPVWAWFIPVCILIIQIVLTIWFASLAYKNRYYAYTENRILIRSGIFGVDYQTLEMKSIGAVLLNVSVLDKILRKNTGTISFGSNSSPVVAQRGGSNYRFAHIVAPYDFLREIKIKIDQAKKNN